MLVDRTTGVIKVDTEAFECVTPMTPPGTPPTREKKVAPVEMAAVALGLPTLQDFIIVLVQESNVQLPTLMATMVYLARLQSKLPGVAKGESPCFWPLSVAL